MPGAARTHSFSAPSTDILSNRGVLVHHVSLVVGAKSKCSRYPGEKKGEMIGSCFPQRLRCFTLLGANPVLSIPLNELSCREPSRAQTSEDFKRCTGPLLSPYIRHSA